MSWRNRDESEEKFYSCEYAKSGRSTCRYCREKIDKSELRLAIHIQSQHFDGTTPTWYHRKCFFNQTYRLKSVERLRGYEHLRWCDQQLIRERLPRNDVPSIQSVKVDKLELIDPQLLSLEYASHNRFKCKTCNSKIQKGTVIVSKRTRITAKNSTKSHLDCFAAQEIKDKDMKCEPEDVPGYNDLKEADQLRIKTFIDSIKSSTLKRKREHEEEELAAKKAKTSFQEKLQAQNERFWSLRDSVNSLQMRVIKDIISANNQSIENVKGHDEIVNFLADMMCFGPLAPCPTCKGQLIPRSNKYSCTGNLSAWTRCLFVTQEPNRRTSLIIYPNLSRRNEFLKNFKFEPTQKLFSAPLEKSVQEIIEAKSSKNANTVYQRMERDTSNIVGGGRVDPKSGLESVGHVVLDENNDHYSCALSLVNILSGTNTFYKMQLIKQNDDDVWYVYRAWGRLGTEIGDSKLTTYDAKEEALKEFGLVFEEKTGFSWKVRRTAEKKPNKFYFVEIEKCYEDHDMENKIRAAQKMCDKDFISTSSLPVQIQNLVKLIFNVENMKFQMRRFKIDVDKMPLGKVSSNTIKKAYSVLTELTSLLENNGDRSLILDASNKFYSLIPHYFGSESPTLLDDPELIKSKLEMLDSLTEIEVAYNLLKAKHEATSKLNEDTDPIDFHFNQLNSDMEVLDTQCDEFKLLKQYVSNTHSKNHQFKVNLEEIFRVSRNGEADTYAKYESLNNKKLLFHGSRITNFASILSKGLKIAPKEAPANGYMFGKGVYFADMVSKSANYCYPSKDNLEGLILVCEVALGNMFERREATGLKRLPDGKHSTFGRGRLMPDPSQSHTTENGIEIPLGVPIEDQTLKSQLIHNEYVVYDTAQINIKYILKVKFNFTDNNAN